MWGKRGALLFLGGAVLLLGALPAAANIAGGSGSSTDHYLGECRTDAGKRCTVDTWIERTPFLMNSVESKYRMVRFVVRNRGDAAIMLSSENDSMTCSVSGKQVRGILRLKKADPSLWGSLSEDMRTELAYPDALEPNQVAAIYVFFPKDEVSERPDSFRYTVESLGDPIVIRREFHETDR